LKSEPIFVGSRRNAAPLSSPGRTSRRPSPSSTRSASRTDVRVSLASLIEFRALVEAWGAGVVAAGAPPQVVRELAALVDQMDAPDVDQVRFHELDAELHLTLVRAAGNELATLVLEGVRSAVAKVMLDAITAAGDWSGTRRRLVREHRAILDAIREGRAAEASELTGSHIRRFYEKHLRT